MSINFTPVSRVASRALLNAKASSPKLMFVAGLVSVGVGTVLASRATLKVEAVLDDAASKLNDIKTVEHSKYTNYDRRTDTVVVYTQTAVRIGRLYAPSVIALGIGVTCLVGSHNILSRRNAALAAAYASLENTYKAYRKRVRDEIGEDREKELHYNVMSDVAHREREEQKSIEPGSKRSAKDPSIYARFFDESSQNWKREPEYNLVFLRAQQTFANDLLHSRGHVFLNEVYDMLGLDRSRAGSVVGWTLSGDGDNHIDFGIFNGETMSARQFVNGWEPVILLDFNVDGVITDKLKDWRVKL